MFYRNKKVLVTGASGFVGSHFIESLLEQGAQIRAVIHERPLRFKGGLFETVQADLSRPEDCLKACQGQQIVVHAAGEVSAAAMTVANPMSAITGNLILTARMLEAAWHCGVERFLVFGSHTAYPVSEDPIKEEDMWTGPTHPVYFGYGWMRRYLERLAEFVASKSPMKIALARPCATYGRYDDFGEKTSHVIPALIRRALKKEDPYVVWGTGEEVRDFLHITDLVRGCLLLIERHAVCDPVNLASGRPVTIAQITQMILKASDHQKANLVFDRSKPVTIAYRAVDTAKAKTILAFEPKLSLEQGINDTVIWGRQCL